MTDHGEESVPKQPDSISDADRTDSDETLSRLGANPDAETIPGAPPKFELLQDSPAPGPLPGSTFGPYKIIRKLGAGGMGEVYEAQQISSGRRLALKVLRNEIATDEHRKRFLREGRLAASVNHPHSVYIYGTEEIDGVFVIAMELVSGGNLREYVERQGPIFYKAAVDLTLQLLSGLEAAEKVGVLHRDIKPANCFVDAQDQVKIGDFGLSVSIYTDPESQLTVPGTFLGTPQFASPEQLKGGDVDVRSDIYSLGATLHYLLTGKPLFEAPNLPAMIAKVIEETPQTTREINSDVPPGLSAAIMRCLEKSPDNRLTNYDSLRSALEPFSSAAPEAARPGFRFLAALFDLYLVGFVTGAIGGAFRGGYLGDPRFGIAAMVQTEQLDPLLLSVEFVLTLFLLAYLMIGEHRFQTTIFKRIFGLRVVALDGGSPSLSSVFIRASIFWFFMSIGDVALRIMQLTELIPAEPIDWEVHHRLSIVLLSFLWILLLIPARKRNGYATVYDLLSRTRVVSRPRKNEGAVNLETINASTGKESDGTQVGPYVIPNAASIRVPGNSIVGYDSILRRQVLIRTTSSDAPSVSDERCALSRPTRLRWLAGARSQEFGWDAYEYVPCVTLAGLSAPQDWATVRSWIRDLHFEIRQSTEEKWGQHGFSVEDVRVGNDGRVRLMERVPSNDMNRDEPPAVGDLSETQQFLAHCARLGLTATDAADDTDDPIYPRLGLPAHACAFLNRLNAAEFESQDELEAAIERLESKPYKLPRSRKIAAAFLTLLLPMTFGIITWMNTRYVESRLFEAEPDIVTLGALLNRHLALEAAVEETVDATEVRALEIYISSRFADSITSEAIRNDPSIIRLFSDSIATADKCLAAHPNPTATEVEWATERLEEFLAQIPPQNYIFAPGWLTYWANFGLSYVLVAIISIVSYTLFRGGLTPRLFGIRLVSSNGNPASRFRCLVRSLFTWVPLLLLIPSVIFLGAKVSPWDLWLALGLQAGGTVWMAFGRRSVQDRIAGTYLVAE